MNDMTFIDSKSWVGAYKRSMAGEGRRNLIVQLNTLIDEAIRAIKSYSGTVFVPLIVNALSRTKGGLNNLAVTYAKKDETVSNIRVILTNIDLTLNEYKHLLTEHYVASLPIPFSESSPQPQQNSPTGAITQPFGTSPIESDSQN